MQNMTCSASASQSQSCRHVENFFFSEKLNCISLLEYLPMKVVVRVVMGGVLPLFFDENYLVFKGVW